VLDFVIVGCHAHGFAWVWVAARMATQSSGHGTRHPAHGFAWAWVVHAWPLKAVAMAPMAPQHKEFSMLLRISLTITLLIGAAGPASAQTILEWKFKAGDKFFLEESVVQKQTFEFMGKDVKQETSNRTLSSFTVLRATADGVVLEKKIESWTNKITGGLVPVDDDKVSKLFKGLTFTFTLSRRGAISDLSGYEQFEKRLADLDEMEAKMIKLILTPETLKSVMDMAFGIVPDRAVNKGDSWRKQIVVPAGPIGTVKFDTRFTYEGNAPMGEQVSALGSFTYELPKKDADGLPFRVLKANFKSPGGKGTIYFDAVQGRLRSFEMNMPMSGSMTLDIAGMQLDMNFSADEIRTIRLTAKNPTGN